MIDKPGIPLTKDELIDEIKKLSYDFFIISKIVFEIDKDYSSKNISFIAYSPNPPAQRNSVINLQT